MTKRVGRLAPALILALCQLSLFAQSPARQNGASTSWADEILKKETYATPPPELADAVLAPRHLNVSLTNASPDKKWFVDEIGDGPVAMKTFSKPFHELGGVFIDYKANRARALTIRNNVGIQLISATDGTRKADPGPRWCARLERHVGARQRVGRVLRPRRGRDAHLRRGRGDRQVPAGDEDAGAGHARFELRVHRRRQADRDRPHSRRTFAAACGADCADRPDRQDRRFGQEPAAHVPEPDVVDLREGPAQVARDRSGRARRRAEGHCPQDRPAGNDPRDRLCPGREVRARDAHGRAVLLRRPGEQLRHRSKRSGISKARCSPR